MATESTLIQLYATRFDSAPTNIAMLAGAGSNRIYYRLYGSSIQFPTVIGTIGTDADENKAFIELSRHFAGRGLPVPEVLAVSPDGMAYLQSDLGDVSLFEYIASGRRTGLFSNLEKSALRSAMAVLAKLQFVGGKQLDFSVCYPQREMDSLMVDRDLNYFKYDFLKPSGIEFSETSLDNELGKLHDVLMKRAADAYSFMVRDFQSRNVMLYDGHPYVIDFQGGRRGPCEYDVASFLWQARANIPENLRSELIESYITEALAVDNAFNVDVFRQALPYYVLFRMLQTLGAYGFRGLIEGKPHFIRSIPAAVANFANHMSRSDMSTQFPYLAEISRKLSVDARVSAISLLNGIHDYDGLTVMVGSFAYKRGIPFDLSGNGGGFVFDCRAIHNPGRYDEYKHLTGRDEAVRRFLEDDGEILLFLQHAEAMADASIERYIHRGFKSLCIQFGCTGGQHRSVYSADALARHVALKYPGVRVVLHHREQSMLEILTDGNSSKITDNLK